VEPPYDDWNVTFCDLDTTRAIVVLAASSGIAACGVRIAPSRFEKYKQGCRNNQAKFRSFAERRDMRPTSARGSAEVRDQLRTV
jgi:hypothetical protein